jgi:N-dimethylarginine dimethylaminohydrolase
MLSTLSEVAPLRHVVLKHPREAFVDQETIATQWRMLNFTEPPDLPRAIDEYDRFVDAIRSCGADITFLPRDDRTTLDSIYVRDASILSPRGLVLANMGKPQRAGEPAAQHTGFAGLSTPVVGAIASPGRLEGGDLIWLNATTVVVGHGYRTNEEGIRQFRSLVGGTVDVIVVPLPHWRGHGDVMHLMSLISPVDDDLAVVYSPLLPVPFREYLLRRGVSLVEVPDEEFDTMGTNVLVIAPRQCIMLAGNPRTRAALEREGAHVIEYEGSEISVKGAGGPTCLTRPILRSA